MERREYAEDTTQRMRDLQDRLNERFKGAWLVRWRYDRASGVVECVYRHSGWTYVRCYNTDAIEYGSLLDTVHYLTDDVLRTYGRHFLLQSLGA